MPVAERLSLNGLSLPSDASLTVGEIDRVAGLLRDIQHHAPALAEAP